MSATTGYPVRIVRSWLHGYDSGEHTGRVFGEFAGWREGYAVGYADGVPVGRAQVETEFDESWSEMRAHVNGIAASPAHAQLIERRSRVIDVKQVPTGDVALVDDWDRLWLAGAPATRFLTSRAGVAA